MQEAVRGLQAAIVHRGGVLLCGEPGTGREMFARAIHHASQHDYDGSVERLLSTVRQARRGGRRAFVTIDCLDQEALEQRLFGLPSLRESPDGDLDCIAEGCAVHQAVGGTLFLRRLPEMPAGLQRRLARVLRDREVWVSSRTGTTAIARVGLRPIGTLDSLASDAIVPQLRTRVAETTITIPPLRKRREDIPGLVRCLLRDVSADLRMRPRTVSAQAIALLSALPWHGNIHELKELLRLLSMQVSGRAIRLIDVLANIRLDGRANAFYGGTLKEARERFEREYLKYVLDQHHGRMADAAKTLGIQRTNLYRKVRRLSVQRRPPGRLVES